MSHTILIHILNEDAIVGEIEEMPDPHSQYLSLRSPRLRDGRDVTYLMAETNVILLPWNRIHSVEVFPSEGEDKIATFVRE